MSAKRKAPPTPTPDTPGADAPVEIFVSYSHANAAWLDRMRPLLRFPRDVTVKTWTDKDIKAGDDFDKDIKAALKRMDIFVCLVSQYFTTSDYIQRVELRQALARARRREVVIVPVMLYKMDLQRECPELAGIQYLPQPGKCWQDYCRDGGDFQDAHHEIRTGLWQAIEEVRKRRR